MDKQRQVKTDNITGVTYNFFSLFYRLKGEDRQRWLPVIEAHQALDTEKTVHICDLHFHPNDLTKNGMTYRPKKNILPQLGYVK